MFSGTNNYNRGMHYYEVQVASRAYHSKQALTYKSDKELSEGSVVTVPLRRQKVVAFVEKKVAQPTFSTKEIISLVDSPPIPKKARALHAWLEEYYPSRSNSSLQLFLPSSLSTKSRKPAVNSYTPKEQQSVPPLTKEQKSVLETVSASEATSFLLHGETGSGKTRVYAELVRKSLDNGKSALILTPEIGLTTQLASQLELMLGVEVIVLHSQLTPKARRDLWQKIAYADKPLVISGTRSALFAPIGTLGTIVIDEAHDDAYKQDQAPHYMTSRVAAKLAALHGAKLVLGSATPTVADYATFKEKDLPILDMKTSARAASELEHEVIDLKNRDLFTKSPYLSNALVAHIERAFASGEQSLIYLNRRGTARLVLCQQCGWESICPRCDIALTFHEDTHQLTCHTCGLSERPPSTCPSCQSPDIFYKSIGTKALIAHIQKLFPEAKIERFDTDQTKDNRLEARFHAVHSGEVDILVGTQLLGKGLDLPLLSVVGVVQADTSLSIPDFSAREKTYQQLHQIIGRVGRGHRKGHIVIQTHHPDSTIIHHALNRDYLSFYQEEIKERANFLYPPFCYLLQVTSSKKNPAAAEKSAHELYDTIVSARLPVQVVGPSPAFKPKTHGNYHWQLVIKSKQRSHLVQIAELLPKAAAYNLDPINLL